MDFSISHLFSVTAEQYMNIYLDPAFEQFIEAESSLKKRRVLSHEQKGPIILRDIEICSGIELPSLLRKVTGHHELRYIEHAVINLDKHETTWYIEPGYLSDKIKANGTTALSPAGPDRTERLLRGSVIVSIPFLGRIAENFIIDAIKNAHNETAKLFDEFRLKNQV